MTFKRRTTEQFAEQLRRLSINQDRAEELLQQQQRAARKAHQAELKGAMIIGMLAQQKQPGTFARHVRDVLSDPSKTPPESLLRLLSLLGDHTQTEPASVSL